MNNGALRLDWPLRRALLTNTMVIDTNLKRKRIYSLSLVKLDE